MVRERRTEGGEDKTREDKGREGQGREGGRRERRTLFFVDTQDDNNFIPPHSNQFLHRSDTTTRQLRKQDHSFRIIILQLHQPTHFISTLLDYWFVEGEESYQFNICTHFRDLADLDHDQFVDFGVLLLVVPHLCVFAVLSI